MVFTLSKKLIATSVIPTFIKMKIAAPKMRAPSEGVIGMLARKGLNLIINIIANNTWTILLINRIWLGAM
jgi:hypothetical protein